MKFILAMLSIICLVFLMGCSAKDTNNINKKELEELANKYGGVYIFNKKYLEEIEKREEERSIYMDSFFKNNNRNFKRDDLNIMDKKLPQILSNGKRYYLDTRQYKHEHGHFPNKLSQIYFDKIKQYAGEKAYNAGGIHEGYFYIDDIGNRIPIYLTLNFGYVNTEYGIFGDEGAGISFTKKTVKDLGGFNKFYLE